MSGPIYKQVVQRGHPRTNQGKVFEHILIAERALGHYLPPRAVVHHVSDNDNTAGLVVCQDQAYHLLLHRRLRALLACGDPSARRCKYCRRYDRPANLVFYGSNVHHSECYNRYRRDLYAAGRGKRAKGKSQRGQ